MRSSTRRQRTLDFLVLDARNLKGGGGGGRLNTKGGGDPKGQGNVGGVGAGAGVAPSSGSHWSVTSNNMIQAGTKRFPPNKQLATSDKNRGVASHSSIDLEWETAEGNQPTLDKIYFKAYRI